MPWSSLRHFVEALEARGELVRISAQVDPVLEIAAIYDHVVKEQGPALLFENVKGSKFPVAINLMGTWSRMQLALGRRDVKSLGEEMANLPKMKPPTSLGEAFQYLPVLKKLGAAGPKIVRRGPVQEVVEKKVDLSKIPVIQCWPRDGGRFITLPLVLTRDPENGERNLGMYRVQVKSKNEVAMHWQLHKHGAAHYRKAVEMDVDLEVAIIIGGAPDLIWSALAPLPDGLDELLFLGFLRGRKIRLVKGKTVGLEVPAEADFVLEGVVKPGDLIDEGPFGDHTGYYDESEPYPRMTVNCITRRENPIYPTTVVGIPPQEDGAMGKAVERIFLPLFNFQVSEVKEMNLPVVGGFHNLAIIQIDKRYPGHGTKVMNAVWGTGQMMFTKCMIIVEHDPHDIEKVLMHVLENLKSPHDVVFLDGAPADSLDHASPYRNISSKIGLDGTRKSNEEASPFFGKDLPPLTIKPHAKVTDSREILFGKIRLFTIEKKKAWQGRGTAGSLLNDTMSWGVRVVVVLDEEVNLERLYEVAWATLSRIDPRRDIQVMMGDDGVCLAIDATHKWEEEDQPRGWPEVIRHDPKVLKKVKKRWDEYGIGIPCPL